MVYLPPGVFDIVKDYANFNPKKAFANRLKNRLHKIIETLRNIRENGGSYNPTQCGQRLSYERYFFTEHYRKYHSFRLMAPDYIYDSKEYGWVEVSSFNYDPVPLMWVARCMQPHRYWADWDYTDIQGFYTQMRHCEENHNKKLNFAVSLKYETNEYLKQFCRDNKIKGFSRKNKKQLITHILKNY